MTTIPRPISVKTESTDELITGDRMNRDEFHRAYKQTPEGFKAELIGGIVYVASPLKTLHGVTHASLAATFVTYKAATPGVQCGDNATVLLGYDAEPQPDLFVRVLPQFGGQTENSDDGYIKGAPELIAEIAVSSRAIDLHAKRNDYLRAGVREYLVVCIAERELRWFDLRADRELFPDADKVYRIRCLPGLWVDAEALFTEDDARLLTTLQRGVASQEHVDFVKALAAAKKA